MWNTDWYGNGKRFGDNSDNGLYNNWLKKRENQADMWNTQTVTTNETVLNHDKLNELFEKMGLDTKEDTAKKQINEILEEKGYPEFDKILDYYLKEHPEYLL